MPEKTTIKKSRKANVIKNRRADTSENLPEERFIVEKKRSAEKYLAWSSEPENIEIVRSKDSYLYDSEGKEYIDFIMGWCVGNFGWGNPEITAPLHNFNDPAYVYPTFLYEPWRKLATLLAYITPGKLAKCFRTTGGTDSVETAMKIAMIYTGRKKFLSVDGCYHGNSIGALSIGSADKELYPNLLSDCYKIDRPLNEAAAKQVEKFLKKKDVAALILEPLLTHPEIHIPEKKFMQMIRELCTKYGTLLVIDEVATGFGRTGKLFACEHYDLEPDVMCLAKAMSGGYSAIGSAITTEKIGSKVEKKINAYPTYGWHPASVNAAISNIDYFIKNQEDILKNAEDLSSEFHSKISKMKFRKNIKINMLGLAISVDVGSSSYASEIAKKCLEKGLLIETNGSNLMMFPALNMTMEVADKGLDILERSI